MRNVISVPRITVREAYKLAVLDRTALAFDCRTPDEFALDHLPLAENAPVLSNEERKQVGTLYKQDEQRAKQLGAALISSHIAQHLQRDLSHRLSKLNILYCARGGLRSQSFSTVLNLVGVETRIIEGGYKAYRNFVEEEFAGGENHRFANLSFHILTGLTGTRKTKTLGVLRARGEQVIDLEHLAKHRGSVLGALHYEDMSACQPPQRWFETQLLHELSVLDPNRPVWIEAEASKIGDINVPHAFWHQIMTSPGNQVFILESELEDRVEFLLGEYAHFLHASRAQELKQRLRSLERIRPELVPKWLALVDAGSFPALVRSLLVEHYDLRYKKSKLFHLLHQPHPHHHRQITTTNANAICNML